MQYRTLGKTGLRVSALGMGCMRLDEKDPETAEKVIDAAIAAGVNYVETARGYVAGKCQHLTALGLKKRSRGLIVSGKARVTPETTADSYRKEIDLQMQILGVDYLEFFQVGWIRLTTLEHLTKKNGALDALNQARSEGLIGHIGFTGHDQPENFTQLVETGIFDCITVPYNMVSQEYAPTIQRAHELGVGVVAMCPVGGGMLANPAAQLQELIPGGAATTTEAAFQFVLSNPSVDCACSGMNSLEMLKENLATVENFKPMGEADLARAKKVLEDFSVVGKRFCTLCGYCMPCPHAVKIPDNFRLYNLARIYGLQKWARGAYAKMDPLKRAEACQRCGACEPKCPNKIPIMDQLAEVAKELK